MKNGKLDVIVRCYSNPHHDATVHQPEPIPDQLDGCTTAVTLVPERAREVARLGRKRLELCSTRAWPVTLSPDGSFQLLHQTFRFHRPG